MEPRFDFSDLDTEFPDLVGLDPVEPALPAAGAPPKAEPPLVEADLAPRALAKLIDVGIGGVLSWLVALPFYGWFVGLSVGGAVGAAYVLLSDSMNGPRRRSLGKKWLDLRVERLDGARIDALTSVRRNGVFAGLYAAQAFAIVAPALSMALLVATLGGIAYEFRTLFYDYEGRRWGDVWAGTDVRQPAAVTAAR